MLRQAVPLLLVEDDDIDAEAFERAVRASEEPLDYSVAPDGPAALARIRSMVEARSVLPVVVLDLNLPGMSGFEVLEELRADARLRRTTVFVLTTSGRDEDLTRAFDLRIAGYFVKSDVGPDYRAFLRLLESFLRLGTFPGPA